MSAPHVILGHNLLDPHNLDMTLQSDRGPAHPDSALSEEKMEKGFPWRVARARSVTAGLLSALAIT